ncbi:MAG: delta-60 repeat domain-containing protein, partial [Candidatus Absconditicoccaceae bacterium]
MKNFLFRSIAIMVLAIGIFSFTHVLANTTSIDSSFDTGLPVGIDGDVYSIVKQNDGKIVLGGSFHNYKGMQSDYIIRLNSDGTKDSSFDIGNGFDSDVNVLAIQSDDKILVGGNFSTYKGVSAHSIVRLNSDGSRDSSFDMGDGFSLRDSVYSIAVQSDGKILVGGGFSTYKGISTNYIVRLNSDGSRDSSFDIGDGFNIYGYVRSIAVQGDGKILIGGEFETYQGISANKIIRLNSDGSRDSSFGMGDGFDYTVSTIAIQGDGKILVGGQFGKYMGSGEGYCDNSEYTDKVSCELNGGRWDYFYYYSIIRLNNNGTVDSSFYLSNDGGFDNNVNVIKVQSDGKIIVGGSFNAYHGVSASSIIRLNSNGTNDSSFDMGSGFDNEVYDITIQNDSKIILAGSFGTYNGIGVNRIVRLNSNGSRDSSFDIGNGFNNSISVTTIQDDGKILAGGDFKSYNGESVNRIIRLNSDGSKDSSFNMGNGFDAAVFDITIQNNSKILIGGNFTNYKGIPARSIIRLNSDGSRDSSFDMGSGFAGNTMQNSHYVNTIAIQDDGKILVGGNFTKYQGVSASYIVRLNPDGSRDSSFNIGSGFGYGLEVFNITMLSGDKILVAGSFRTYQGITGNSLILLNSDGSRDYSFSFGSGFSSSYIKTLLIQNDNKIIVGGAFISGGIANRMLRLNSDWSIDSSFNFEESDSFNGYLNSIAIQSDNKILIGGSIVGTSTGIMRLNANGSRDSSFDIGDGFDGGISRITMLSGGKTLIAGGFTSYNGMAIGYLTLLYGENSNDIVILPNTTNSTTVNNEFTNKGYIQSSGDLVGSNSISLSETNGNVPKALSIKNNNITLSIPADTQFKKADNVTNYNGIISVPITKSVSSVNDGQVLSAFKVGSSTESIKLVGGVATLSLPVSGKTIGDPVNIYYSQNNGVSRYPQITTTVIDVGGQPYVEFTTNHFTDFAITDFAGSFTINNDAASTSSTGVTLNISTSPAASYIRFSNDGSNRSSREGYSTSKTWTLTGDYGTKTVYAQFDADGDQVSDVETSDSISYAVGSCAGGGAGEACLSLEITAVTGECRYGINLDLGSHAQTYGAFTMTGSFLSNHANTNRRSCNDTAGKAPWNMQISSTDLIAGSYSIANTAIEMKTSASTKYRGSTSFTGLVGAFASRGTDLSTPRKIFEK